MTKVGKLTWDSFVTQVLGLLVEAELPAIIFVRHRKAVEMLSEALVSAGYSAIGVTGLMPCSARGAVQAQILAGRVEVAVATECWGTGVDIPNLRSIIMATGGQAPIGLRQRAGRGTRLAEGKESFTIYDMALGDREAQKTRHKHYCKGGLDNENAPVIDSDLAKLLG